MEDLPGKNIMKSILVVDDDYQMRGFLEEVLGEKGYSVKTAESLGQAERMMKESRFDVVLCDEKLPDGSGYEFRMRHHPAPPFIMFSGGDELFLTRRSTPETAILMKPLNLQLLLALIRDLGPSGW